jgi:hypothetical protein
VSRAACPRHAALTLCSLCSLPLPRCPCSCVACGVDLPFQHSQTSRRMSAQSCAAATTRLLKSLRRWLCANERLHPLQWT